MPDELLCQTVRPLYHDYVSKVGSGCISVGHLVNLLSMAIYLRYPNNTMPFTNTIPSRTVVWPALDLTNSHSRSGLGFQ